MNTIYIFTSILFFIWVLRNIFFWVGLWQTKEYRLDRLFAHLQETSQGKRLLFSPLNIVKWIGILIYPYIVIYEVWLPLYAVVICGVYVYEFISFSHAFVTRQIKRPVFTGKALLLIVLTFSFITGLYSLGIIQQGFLWLLILDKATPVFIAFFVFFLSVPTMLFQDYKIDQAIKKLSRFPNIVVIGVTGSFGKSSTKEYTAHILSQKFSVVKTKGTNNTPIGLANTILSKISEKTEIFVAEMGAYKRGEIAQLCDIARPKIGILTAVGMQHLSLFGSPEKLAKTKYELIESLPQDGIGLFNASNEGAYSLYKKTKKKKIAYGVHTDEKKTQKIDITAINVTTEKDGVSFSVRLHGKSIQCKTPLLGEHTVENILPGIYLADNLGMTEQEIKEGVATLTSLPHTMVLQKSIHETAMIDDTFNVNPDGVIAAMHYAKMYKGKKILVLEPMIELGVAGKQEHYRVGKTLSTMCDVLFLTKKNFYTDVVAGVKAGGGTCRVEVARPGTIADYINNNSSRSDIVVFEGKEAAVSMNKIV